MNKEPVFIGIDLAKPGAERSVSTVNIHNRILPVAVWPGKVYNPYNPWYCTTKNKGAAATILWFGLGYKVM